MTSNSDFNNLPATVNDTNDTEALAFEIGSRNIIQKNKRISGAAQRKTIIFPTNSKINQSSKDNRRA